jgi:predicted Zn-dependent protease
MPPAQFEKMVAAQDKPIAALTMVGMIEQMQSRLPEAEQAFQRVLRLDPRAGAATNNLAWIYAERGANLDTALQLAQTAKATMPDQPQVNDTLGWVYFKKDMLPMAINTLQHTWSSIRTTVPPPITCRSLMKRAAIEPTPGVCWSSRSS